MLFFYIRHGDPIYNPDSLTPLGLRQAEALAKRLSLYGMDKIYASTSERAKQTARPTCELLKKELHELDFCNEGHAWNDFTVKTQNGVTWAFQSPEMLKIFATEECRRLGDRWYDHPKLSCFKKGIERIKGESDSFFASLGYEHIPDTGTYKIIRPNDERIALFAHQGFGLAFLSCVLDIPYPIFSRQFDICHSGMTVIEFAGSEGITHPKVLTLSSDSHIYRDGLPTNYNNYISF